MKTAIPILNFLFSIFESAAAILLIPLTLVTIGALIVMTAFINRKIRTLGPSSELTQLWSRSIRQGA